MIVARKKAAAYAAGGSAPASTSVTDRTAFDLVTRIMVLIKLLEDEGVHGIALVDNQDGTFRVSTGRRNPSTWHDFNRDGHVSEYTCQYNGHNGDSYDERVTQFDYLGSVAVLQKISADLENRCIDAEERRLEEAARQTRHNVALSNLNARLRTMGVR